MRHLQTYEDPKNARGLSDQLEIQGIENQILSEDASHAVWIINEQDLEAAKELARLYNGVSTEADRAQAERVRKDREAIGKPVRIPGLTQPGASRGGPVGQLTLGLIVLSVLVSVFSSLGDVESPILRGLFIVPVEVTSTSIRWLNVFDWSQPWRLLTPMLIHFGILHLAFNMLWLYRLGSQIESMSGVLVWIGLVLAAQIPGALVQFETSGPLFGGMSGVVYGLFGYSWMQARYGSRGYVITDQDTLWIMGWFILCATGLIGHIANAQHALGLVFGLILGMPAYLAFRRGSADVKFEKGSWADLNIVGFQRFKRQYFEPYVPLWFVALAGVVLLLD